MIPDMRDEVTCSGCSKTMKEGYVIFCDSCEEIDTRYEDGFADGETKQRGILGPQIDELEERLNHQNKIKLRSHRIRDEKLQKAIDEIKYCKTFISNAVDKSVLDFINIGKRLQNTIEELEK